MTLLRRVLAAVVAPVALTATSCEQEQPEVPEVPQPTSAATDAQPSRTPIRNEVPQSCDDLINYTSVLDLVGVAMQGSNDQIYNDDVLESSGRTARLSCQYGVPFDLPEPVVTATNTPAPTPSPSPTPAPPAAVVIAVSSYTDAEIARARVEDTVTGAQGDGSQVSARPVGEAEAFLLSDDDGLSLVLADGALTYVFTVRRDLVAPENEEATLVDMAEEVVGIEDVTPSPTTTPAATSAPPATS